MGEYTYIVGLVAMGLSVFAAGMYAAERERRAPRRDKQPSLALPRAQSTQPAAHAPHAP